jgi:transcription antitermination factor NusG
MGARKMLDGTESVVAHNSLKADVDRHGLANRLKLPETPRRSEALEGAQALPVRKPFQNTFARWYCIQHRPMEGARARLAIRREGFDVHWPRAIVRGFRRDDVLEPLFPGYLFVLFDVRRGGWGAIRQADHVEAILGVREIGAPIALPLGVVEGLIDMARGAIGGAIDCTGDPDGEGALAERPILLEAGAPVSFLDEALFAQPALLKADRGGERVKVLMTFFGEEVEVSVRRKGLKVPT